MKFLFTLFSHRSNIKRHCSHNHLFSNDVNTLPRSTSAMLRPNGLTFHQSCSFDELSTARSNRNYCCPSANSMITQHHRPPWPKVIPKAMPYHREHHQSNDNIPLNIPPPPALSFFSNNNNIEEFDLEKLEKDFRRSHSNLLELNRDYGTAV